MSGPTGEGAQHTANSDCIVISSIICINETCMVVE